MCFLSSKKAECRQTVQPGWAGRAEIWAFIKEGSLVLGDHMATEVGEQVLSVGHDHSLLQHFSFSPPALSLMKPSVFLFWMVSAERG